MNRVYPLKNVAKKGKQHCYSDLKLNYSASAKNTISMPDSLLFKPGWTDNMRNGIQHRLPINMPIKLFKYLTWTTSLNLTDKMYLSYLEKSWVTDTITPQGYVKTDTINKFRNVFTYDVSSNITTKLYGMIAFKKGPVRAIRHVITPQVGFSYNPDYSSKFWNYYGTYTDAAGTEQLYSLFQNGIFGSPQQSKAGKITYSINNNLEIKVPSRKDTVNGLKKIVLIENLSLSGNYDLAKDSLNWSYLTVSNGQVKCCQLQRVVEHCIQIRHRFCLRKQFGLGLCFKANRFKQIVGGAYFITIYSIRVKGCHEDHFCFFR